MDPNFNMHWPPGPPDMMMNMDMGPLPPINMGGPVGVRRIPHRAMSVAMAPPMYNPAMLPHNDYAMPRPMGVRRMAPPLYDDFDLGGQAILPAREFRYPRAWPPGRPLHPSVFDYDDSDDEIDLGALPMPLVRRATIPGPMIAPPPFLGPLVHHTGAVVDSYQFQRPYSYASGYQPGGPVYPFMGQDLAVLRTLLTGDVKAVDMKPYIDILAQRSPYEIEALRYNFQTMTGGIELSLAINTVLDANSQRQSVKYAFTGLVRGPVLFDLWLLQQVTPR
jgi:hypothetical protein